MREIVENELYRLKSGILSENSYSLIDQLIKKIANYKTKGILSQKDIESLNKSFGKEFLENTIQGHGFRKPLGYPGDYLIMDKIYTTHISENPKFAGWDKYFHSHSAPKAVRNRKKYFKQLLKQKLQVSPELNLLNIASGPARELFELYSQNKNIQLTTTCIETDQNAIAYAKKLNHKFLDRINFINKSILRFNTTDKYDLIWSSGLFDYFDDKIFVRLLKRLRNWLKPDGEIIIGNFNESHNPSRDFMEIFGDWYLIHRTEKKLKQLAELADFEKNKISIGREKENVNLFLHLKY